MKKLTNSEKIAIVSQSPEIISATKLLVALMINIKAKNFVRIGYEFSPDGKTKESFELILQKVKGKNYV